MYDLKDISHDIFISEYLIRITRVLLGWFSKWFQYYDITYVA